MPEAINYPVEPHDIAVLGRPGAWRRSWMLRPLRRGWYSLLVEPAYMPAGQWLHRIDLEFDVVDGSPERVEVTIPEPLRGFRDWTWKLVRWPSLLDVEVDERLSVHDRRPPDSELLFNARAVVEGRFSLEGDSPSTPHRLVLWSCNQPFETGEEGGIIVNPLTPDIFDWYERQVKKVRPHMIWGLGDTAYSDGTEASDFIHQFYNHSSVLQRQEGRSELLVAYRRMYRAHWSFSPLQYVMRNYPHICIWDDHEVRDGWGSESSDFRNQNTLIFDHARQVAEEYILSNGPRVRPAGRVAQLKGEMGGRRLHAFDREPRNDAHQAYIDGTVASFVFDCRSSRRYKDPGGQVVSPEQMEDFRHFCKVVARRKEVKFLVLGNGVPFINLWEFIEHLIAKAPEDFLDRALGLRDDVRDGWHAPGNQEQLEELIDILRGLHREHPSLEIANVSGDIHVANMFSFQPPGFTRAIYQVTTSALTNRQAPADWVNDVIQVGALAFSRILGPITRVWPTVSDPNILLLECEGNNLRATLKVYDLDVPEGERGQMSSDKDLSYLIGSDRFVGQHHVPA